MKKIIPILIVGFLILSGFGTVANSDDDSNNYKFIAKSDSLSIAFSSPIIENAKNEYIELSFKDSTTYLSTPGQPMLPKVVKSFELPFGARNVTVDVIPRSIYESDVEIEIKPASVHIPLVFDGNNIIPEKKKDMNVYSSEEPYPSEWYNYRIGVGLNADNKRVTHVFVNTFPIRYAPALGKIYVADSADIIITYEEPTSNLLPTDTEYDLVIIAPSRFSNYLSKFASHKNSFGVDTFLMTTEEIYGGYNGVDKPEQIKYFIKDAIEKWDVKYVLLVGGLKSFIWAKPRDDQNQGSRDWFVPVRYTNLFDQPEHPLAAVYYDPGVISDLYYMDVYREGAEFESWDPNGDGIFAAWNQPGVENDSGIDFVPDVSLGRLACRNLFELRTVIDKIIKYEKTKCDPSWFKRMVSVSGDGFLDQADLDIQWDTTELKDGQYTIYAQSKNPIGIYGPVDSIHVTIDKSKESSITFNHDDHLQISSYPGTPISEITSPSNGDILGNTDVFYEPTESEGYCNEFNGWANVEYENGIMHIRGKSYDPKPYGKDTSIHIFITNEEDQEVFSEWRNDTVMIYEGEWITGEKTLMDRGGALYYMPEDFDKEIVWASKGNMDIQSDLIKSLSEGWGFAFLSGHGSPNSWGDHYPGVPGNRGHGSFTGLVVYDKPPSANGMFPMHRITNYDKPSVILIGGCHNSQFNVSMIASKLDNKLTSKMWTYGRPIPECFSWYLVKLPRRGAIATIGNTGLGYGTLGETTTIDGLDGGICIDFFEQYGLQYDNIGYGILGDAFQRTVTNYVKNYNVEEDDHAKTIQQWALLGDPSLRLGGYP